MTIMAIPQGTNNNSPLKHPHKQHQHQHHQQHHQFASPCSKRWQPIPPSPFNNNNSNSNNSSNNNASLGRVPMAPPPTDGLRRRSSRSASPIPNRRHHHRHHRHSRSRCPPERKILIRNRNSRSLSPMRASQQQEEGGTTLSQAHHRRPHKLRIRIRLRDVPQISTTPTKHSSNTQTTQTTQTTQITNTPLSKISSSSSSASSSSSSASSSSSLSTASSSSSSSSDSDSSTCEETKERRTPVHDKPTKLISQNPNFFEQLSPSLRRELLGLRSRPPSATTSIRNNITSYNDKLTSPNISRIQQHHQHQHQHQQRRNKRKKTIISSMDTHFWTILEKDKSATDDSSDDLIADNDQDDETEQENEFTLDSEEQDLTTKWRKKNHQKLKTNKSIPKPPTPHNITLSQALSLSSSSSLLSHFTTNAIMHHSSSMKTNNMKLISATFRPPLLELSSQEIISLTNPNFSASPHHHHYHHHHHSNNKDPNARTHLDKGVGSIISIRAFRQNLSSRDATVPLIHQEQDRPDDLLPSNFVLPSCQIMALMFQEKLKSISRTSWAESAFHLVTDSKFVDDDLSDVLEVAIRFSHQFQSSSSTLRPPKALVRQDFNWWSSNDDDDDDDHVKTGGTTLHFGLLRRMLAPICCRIILSDRSSSSSVGGIKKRNTEHFRHPLTSNTNPSFSSSRIKHAANNNNNNNNDNNNNNNNTNDTKRIKEQTSTLVPLDYSLLDVLLCIDDIQPRLLDGLVYVIGRLSKKAITDKNYSAALKLMGLKTSILRSIDNVASTYHIVDRSRLLQALRMIIASFSLSFGMTPTRLIVNEIVQGIPNVTIKQQQQQQQQHQSKGDDDDEELLLMMSEIGKQNEKSIQDFFFHFPKNSQTKKISKFSSSSSSSKSTITSRQLEAKSSPIPTQWKERLAIRKMRRKLLRYGSETKQGSFFYPYARRRRKIPPSSTYDGSLVITSHEMTIDEFFRRSDFMTKVNKTIERNYIHTISRPRLQRLALSEKSIRKMRSLFFDEDGSLSDAACRNIESSDENDPRYITFQNRACLLERRDKRWQVPIRKLGLAHAKVEALFSKEGILNLLHERLDDVGLLFGGTEDQSLHHDTARQTTCWLVERPDVEDGYNNNDDNDESLSSVPGWEIDRVSYNRAMASAYAPSSMIVGLGDSKDVFLGVQRDQIERIQGNKKFCRIRNNNNGKKRKQQQDNNDDNNNNNDDDQIYEIIRENEHLAALRIKTGCMFTGDFPHAGVRNFRHDSLENDLMLDLNNKIANIVYHHQEGNYYPHQNQNRRIQRTNALIEMMRNFQGLDKLCRLHCSTKMLRGEIYIPQNAIGFTDCLPNCPDRRCYEGEIVPSSSEEDEDDDDDDDEEKKNFNRIRMTTTLQQQQQELNNDEENEFE